VFFSHLRMERYPVSETSFFSIFRIPDDEQIQGIQELAVGNYVQCLGHI
jgi:hypothetical protein